MKSEKKRILIVRLGAVGDVIRTLPALRALRANLPEAYISWVVEDKAASLLQGHPDLDDLLLVPRTRWEQNKWTLRTLKEIRDFVQALRQENFDLVLDFHGLLKSGLITFLSGARERIGFSRRFSKEGNFLFTNQHVRLPVEKMNRIERNLYLIKSLGLEVNGHVPVIPVSEKDREYVDHVFFAPADGFRRPRVIMHPGSSPKTLYKRWDYHRFARLADVLIAAYGARVLFTGERDEEELITAVIREMKERDFTVCQTKTLTRLTELIRRCDLYVGNDTAPMHLAAFVGTPVIGLFGPTDPLENAPYDRGASVVIRKDVSCNPCRNRQCQQLLCMDAITVEDVLEPVARILHGRGFPVPLHSS
jgi:heptosyltransferase I